MSQSITHVQGNGGLPKIVIDHPLAEGEIYLHGAHLTHWKPAGAEPVIYMSPKAIFADGTAIRGGIPICLPWFGPFGTNTKAPAHGLVRTRAWDFVDASESDVGVTVRLRLNVDYDTHPQWTHPFVAELTASFGRTLNVTLAVTNTGPAAFPFEEALHTYFRVRDARETTVGGLTGTTYLDKPAGGVRRREEPEAIQFTAETDRVYLDTTATCVINDPHLGRRIFVEKDNSKSTIVWNPFPAKAASQKDLGEENWDKFVCVETANVGENAVTIEPGETHEMHLHLRLDALENA